jgi:glycine cleavage system H protein
MSNTPTDRRYAKSHEWIKDEGDGSFTIGITAHAQELLGDLVFIDLPEVGSQVEAGTDCAVVESVKAASDVYSPVTGEVIAVNEALEGTPETINEDAYGAGWMFKVKATDSGSMDELFDSDGYDAMIAEEG